MSKVIGKKLKHKPGISGNPQGNPIIYINEPLARKNTFDSVLRNRYFLDMKGLGLGSGINKAKT